MKVISFKAQRSLHESGYRYIKVKGEKGQDLGEYHDVIHLRLGGVFGPWINIDCQKKENNWRFNPSLSFTSLTDLRFTYEEEDYVKKVCEYGLNKGDYTQFQSVPNRNYYVRLYFDSYGSWGNVFTYLAVGFLIAFGIIETVKTIVLYIMGISVWKGGLQYAIIFIASLNADN